MRDPLKRVAADLAGQTQLLCLDEFYVASITDAMLLAGLLETLFEHRLTLVATSNIHPDRLYAGGLQRARFLPAIELIKRHTEVLELAGETDYRLKTLRKDGTYHYPADAAAEANMRDAFDALSSHADQSEAPIEVNDRRLPVIRRTEGAIWFDFETLCNTPRSQDDYIEIAREHHSVFLSGLPALDDRRNDAARRLLNLLDVFYDARVKLIVSAHAPIDGLYNGQALRFEFERATSRLMEMQSESYLTRTHRG
jgi:cell division protein ZapE